MADSSKVWAILSSHRASSEDAFWGDKMVVCVKEEASGGDGMVKGEVGEMRELRDGEGDVGFRCSGDGRCGFASRRAMCDGDSARCIEFNAIVVR